MYTALKFHNKNILTTCKNSKLLSSNEDLYAEVDINTFTPKNYISKLKPCSLVESRGIFNSLLGQIFINLTSNFLLVYPFGYPLC